jgi:hypothetical protein
MIVVERHASLALKLPTALSRWVAGSDSHVSSAGRLSVVQLEPDKMSAMWHFLYNALPEIFK